MGIKALVVGAVALAVGLSATADALKPSAQRACAPAQTPTVYPQSTTQRLPRSFFGYWPLSRYEQHLGAFERILTMLRVADNGPLVRIGGNSADRTFYRPGSRRLPPNAYLLTPAWFQSTSTVVRDLGLLGPAITSTQYPLDACASVGSPSYPTIAKVLSRSLSVGMADSVRPAVNLAHRAKRPFRLDEMNSVTCGGRPGVSNTFATALWAPDALFEMVTTRTDGVNLHIRPDTINGPLEITSSGLSARPLLYGLILFLRTAGPSGALVRMKLKAPRSARLAAWSVRVTGGVMHVLLVDKGSQSVNVTLRLPGKGSATVQRLLGPSADATSGVTLGEIALPASGVVSDRRSRSPAARA